LKRLSPSTQHLDPYGVPVEVHISAGVAPEAAYFDAEPEFPQKYRCFALFLDWDNALVLKKMDSTADEYQRIGNARFIWTPSQRQAEYNRAVGNITLYRGIQCHCPITNQDERITVTSFSWGFGRNN